MKWKISNCHTDNLIFFREPLRVCLCVWMHVSCLCSACVECHREKQQVLMSREVSWHPAMAFVCHYKKNLFRGPACKQQQWSILPNKVVASFFVNFQLKCDDWMILKDRLNTTQVQQIEQRTLDDSTHYNQQRAAVCFFGISHLKPLLMSWKKPLHYNSRTT